jgi:perosamine synthetase
MVQEVGTPYYEYQQRIKQERIPYYEPWLGEEELAEVTETIRNNWISEGAKTREFEIGLAQRFGVKYAFATNNCTGALIISLKTLGVGPGDEVIVPAFTFIASASVINLAGGTPVFVDINRDTFTIDPKEIEEAITPRTKAIIAVHLYGQAADMDAILAVAKRHNLPVLEDAAQGLGVQFNGKPAGSFGVIGCTSFFTDKSITIGEGGAVLTNSDEVAKEILMLKNDGRPERGVYYHHRIGYNLRITDLQAAVGVAQLRKMDRILELKKEHEALYRRRLSRVKGVTLTYQDPRVRNIPHRVNILVEEPQALSDYLYEQGVGTRRFYIPVPQQPAYDLPTHYPNADWAFDHGLSLPSSPLLREDQIEYVCDKIEEFMERRR